MQLVRLRGPLLRVPLAPLLSSTLGLDARLAQLRLTSPAALTVDGRRYASVKSQGAYRLPNKKTRPKYLGAKKAGDEYVIPGNIIYKQRGTVWHPGENTIMGRDHTIHAAVAGYVKYYRDPKRHPKRQYIGVVFDRADTLPHPEGVPRKRRLGLVATTRPANRSTVPTSGPNDIPMSVVRRDEIKAKPEEEAPKMSASAAAALEIKKANQAARSDKPLALTSGKAFIRRLAREKVQRRLADEARREAQRQAAQAELEERMATRILRLQENYSYRETNWEIGRLIGDTGGPVPGTQDIDVSRKSKFRLRRKKRLASLLFLKRKKLALARRRREFRRRVVAKREKRAEEKKAKKEQVVVVAKKVAGEKNDPKVEA